MSKIAGEEKAAEQRKARLPDGGIFALREPPIIPLSTLSREVVGDLYGVPGLDVTLLLSR